jgi:hypothetical protein
VPYRRLTPFPQSGQGIGGSRNLMIARKARCLGSRRKVFAEKFLQWRFFALICYFCDIEKRMYAALPFPL